MCVCIYILYFSHLGTNNKLLFVLQSDQSDLSCHRLTAEELSQKLSSRQSHNVAIARATLLSAGAQTNQPFTPALAARLRAATEQVQHIMMINDLMAKFVINFRIPTYLVPYLNLLQIMFQVISFCFR